MGVRLSHPGPSREVTMNTRDPSAVSAVALDRPAQPTSDADPSGWSGREPDAPDARVGPVGSTGDDVVSGDEAAPASADHDVPPGFLPTGPARLGIESVFVRLIATAGVVGIGTALGAILVSQDVAGWIVGLSVSLVRVALAAVLWRSRGL
jgi:hypothetical protein